jgi:transcriptional repressor NrdR
VRCPVCSSLDDKVVDSRAAEDGGAIRRRRECLHCGRRFTTYERVEDVALTVVKRDGTRQPFDRAKVASGVRSSAKNLPLVQARAEDIAADVEEAARLDGPEVTSEQVGVLVLARLRELDPVAYVRFASVYKGFTDPAEFTREIRLLGKRDTHVPSSPESSPGAGSSPGSSPGSSSGSPPSSSTPPSP